ncbi:NUDIX domain-containing protein [Candidatus Uhrbacteria bacterium]|nr:NUDIX domain-containing protein [Candidatus Uhrbacteria bacterium]
MGSPKERFKMIPAVYVLLAREGKVLLIRRFQTGYCDGMYTLPSGHVDGGESLVTAAVREAAEEVGVRIRPDLMRLSHVRHRNAEDGERLDFFFVAKSWEGEPTNAEPHKCDTLRWEQLQNLPANTLPHVREVITAIGHGETYSDEGFHTSA